MDDGFESARSWRWYWRRGSRGALAGVCVWGGLFVVTLMVALFARRGMGLLVYRGATGAWGIVVGSWGYRGYVLEFADGPPVHSTGGWADSCLGIGAWRDVGWMDPVGIRHPTIYYVWIWYWYGPALMALLIWRSWGRYAYLHHAAGRHCRRCGYDLRKHQVGQRCPECGQVYEGAEA